MNSVLKIFRNESQEIRAVSINGEPWFVASDVCGAFGETNRSRAMQPLEDDEKGYTQIDTPGGRQSVAIVNESGLYSMLFAMQPTKARGVTETYIQERVGQLKAFKRWITHDVIPDIRRNGMYATPDTVERLLADPDAAIQLLTQYKAEKQQRQVLEAQAEKDRPKVLFADSVAASRQSILIGELAKLLRQNGVEIGQNRLFTELRRDGFLCNMGERYNQPTQYSMERGWMEIKESSVIRADGTSLVTRTPKITGKGQVYFVNRYVGKEARA